MVAHSHTILLTHQKAQGFDTFLATNRCKVFLCYLNSNVKIRKVNPIKEQGKH